MQSSADVVHQSVGAIHEEERDLDPADQDPYKPGAHVGNVHLCSLFVCSLFFNPDIWNRAASEMLGVFIISIVSFQGYHVRSENQG